MTAAPEPRTHLALVAHHPSLSMVVAPRRLGTVTPGGVPYSPAHRLVYPGHTHTTGINTLCP